MSDTLRTTLTRLAVWSALLIPAQAAITPPGQPASGPGGSTYSHARVTSATYDTGAEAYWIFEPDGPRPPSAPVIIFLHGWGAMEPGPYTAWIEHLVRRGNIVIYPRYQEAMRSPPPQITDRALAAVRKALDRLQSEASHVRPDLSRLAAVGHSAGGQVTANLAARAAEAALPPIKAVMAVQPGKSWGPQRMAVPLEDMKKIPAGTLLLAVAGDRDTLAREVDAQRIFRESVNVSAADKDYIVLVTDEHGEPPLVADHFAPCARAATSGGGLRGRAARQRAGAWRERAGRRGRGADTGESLDAPVSVAGGHSEVNALDYYGTWKLFDALTSAAFYGRDRQYALGNTPEQRCMGVWSDGVPVKELKVTDRP